VTKGIIFAYSAKKAKNTLFLRWRVLTNTLNFATLLAKVVQEVCNAGLLHEMSEES
jgi:hypothetical protein